MMMTSAIIFMTSIAVSGLRNDSSHVDFERMNGQIVWKKMR